jgi:tetratricopeptide (TPR) repeat protein
VIPSTSGVERSRLDLLDPDALAALEEQRDFLLRSLEDLEREHDAGDVDHADYLALKDDYTARAAQVIRAIESRQSAFAARAEARSLPPRRVVAIVAVVVALGLAAGWLVAASSGERGPGDQITGDIRTGSIEELARARQHFARALQAESGQEAVAAYQQAIESYERVLEVQPDNVEALTYRGWLLHTLATQASASSPETAADLREQALEWLDRAVAADSGYVDARIFRAIVLEGAGRPADALADLEAVDAAGIPPDMGDMVDGLRDRIAGQLIQEGSSGP